FVNRRDLHSFPTRRSSDLRGTLIWRFLEAGTLRRSNPISFNGCCMLSQDRFSRRLTSLKRGTRRRRQPSSKILLATFSAVRWARSEEHTSELQSQSNLVCR